MLSRVSSYVKALFDEKKCSDFLNAVLFAKLHFMSFRKDYEILDNTVLVFYLLQYFTAFCLFDTFLFYTF